MTISSRRRFLAATLSVAAGGAFGGLARAAADSPPAAGFGPLRWDPKNVLRLPTGFTWQVVSKFGLEMDDGLRVPHLPDGMAAFAGRRGRVVLVCNHEIDHRHPELGAFGDDLERLDRAGPLFDRGGGRTPGFGGTTTVIWNPATGQTERRFLSLAGTHRNCAGGPTPWGSWLSCEEATTVPGEKDAGGTEHPHGWCFEVSADPDRGPAPPVPIRPMGRFYREAVAVDPATGVVYQTEDRADGLIYRYVPDEPGRLAAGGRLEALALADRPGAVTTNAKGAGADRVPVGEPLAVTWVPLEEVEAPDDDLRHRGHAAGAATFARGEGMWFGDGAVWFCCTIGGPAQKGQVFRYRPGDDAGDPGTLELFYEEQDGTRLENADNLTVAPFGDLIVCEDQTGDVVSPSQRLVGITPEGRVYHFAETRRPTELAGACFSPDGRILFVNLQQAGLTLAIRGPWGRRRG